MPHSRLIFKHIPYTLKMVSYSVTRRKRCPVFVFYFEGWTAVRPVLRCSVRPFSLTLAELLYQSAALSPTPGRPGHLSTSHGCFVIHTQKLPQMMCPLRQDLLFNNTNESFNVYFKCNVISQSFQPHDLDLTSVKPK